MSALTFALQFNLQQSLDVSPLTPDNLAGKSNAEINALPLQYGKRQLRVDAVFTVSGDDSTQIIMQNSNSKLEYIGHSMKTGSITVHGDTGAYAGFHMKGGELHVNGNVGDFAASGLAGGMMVVNGNAGDFLGAAIAGDKKGMRGGIVIIKGNVGDRAGDQMRRGMILIEGNAGNYCASRMLAGTIGVLGDVGMYAGFGQRRGTLLLSKKPSLYATIKDCGAHTLPYLKLMFKSFSALPSRFNELTSNRVHKYAGDVANDGKGEILILI